VYASLVRMLIRRNVRRANAGDVEPLLRAYAPDATLVYPGRHSWAGEYRGSAEIERFLRRFAAVGLRGEAHEILVNGPPWNTKVCVRFTDEARASDGRVVYANRAILFGRIVWGRIVYQEDFLDTQKVAAFDDYLGADGRTSPAS
jgi:ketosteroid isomerase-like protein